MYGHDLDIAVILEAKSNDDENIRVGLGPYQKEEKAKYFTLENDISEGMIFDIDIWHINVSMPKMSITNFIRIHQRTCSQIVNEIKNKVIKELK